MSETLLRAEAIVKHFPGVLALNAVSFDLKPGEVHVLFGENGAGKSTLTKVFTGSYQPDAGKLYLNGKEVSFRNPHDAAEQGISAVYQEFSLVPQLTVVENLFLGREIATRGLLNHKAMVEKARRSLEELGFDLNPTALVGQLTRAERQMVEITKAFQAEMSVLILDEPTASLSDKEVNRLFELIGRFTDQGVGVIYISHRMDELKRIGDRITVLRDGRRVATLDMDQADEDTLISLMTGRSFEAIFPEIDNQPGPPVLEVEGLATASGLRDVSFTVRAGEILGLAGLVGSGKSRAGRAVFGLERATAGKVRLSGRELQELSPAANIRRGVLYFPADRHKEGLVLCRSVKENLTLPQLQLFERGGFIQLRRESGDVRRLVEKMAVRPGRIESTINYLSGGNQQKVMLARGLLRASRVFIFDEATCGIDVGAKVEVYQFMKELAAAGAGVVLISSELPEVLHMSHRVVVMHAGTVAKTLPGRAATEEEVLAACFGREYTGQPSVGAVAHAATGAAGHSASEELPK
jgi:ribose transport system ATP-binding protein